MKRYTLNLLMAACAVVGSVTANAQNTALLGPRMLVHSPASVAGFKAFSESNDGDATSTTNWGRAIDSAWLNIPLVKVIDSLGCPGSITNGPALLDNFALIYRGECDFSEKAYAAQQAGAIGVIIINNVPGQINFLMSGGGNAANVTIPVVIVPKEEGDPVNAQLKAGESVNVSLTNWGFNFNDDLALVKGSLPLFHSFAIPYKQLDAQFNDVAYYRTYHSAIIANTGVNDQTNALITQNVSFTPASGGAATAVYGDTIGIASFEATDSAFIITSSRFGNFEITQPGTFKYDFNLISDAVDEVPYDNTASFNVMATDSIFCKGRYDMATGPLTGGATKFGDANLNMTWGPMYYIADGGYQAMKLELAVSDGDSTLNNEPDLYVYIYKWVDDENNPDSVITKNELTKVGMATKSFGQGDENFKAFTMDVLDADGAPNPVILEDNTWYWIAADCKKKLRLGIDNDPNQYSFFTRSAASESVDPRARELYAPQFIGTAAELEVNLTDTIMSFPFTNVTSDFTDSISFINTRGIIPNIALHLSQSKVTSINKVTLNPKSLIVYPNPANRVVNFKVEMLKAASKVEYSVVDIYGRSVTSGTRSHYQSGEISIPTAEMAPGMYFLNVSVDGAKGTRSFTVIR